MVWCGAAALARFGFFRRRRKSSVHSIRSVKREVFYFGGVAIFSIKIELHVLELGPPHSSKGHGMVVEGCEGGW